MPGPIAQQKANEWAAQHGLPFPYADDLMPMGGQLHGRPYVGPPTEPSRALPVPAPTDVVAIAYRMYSEALTAACHRFRAIQDNAWQEYTRVMQDANAAYEVEVRRAGLHLDQTVSQYHNG